MWAEESRKKTVVLDLDMTLIAAQSDRQKAKRGGATLKTLHDINVVYRDMAQAESYRQSELKKFMGGESGITVINPEELQKFFRELLAGVDDGDVEIVFLTAGRWPPSIVGAIADTIGLTQEEKEKLQKARFRSGRTDAEEYATMLHQGKVQDKDGHVVEYDSRYHSADRFAEIFQRMDKMERMRFFDPRFNSAQSILFDDSPEHCYGFRQAGAQAVQPRHDLKKDIASYEEVLDMLPNTQKRQARRESVKHAQLSSQPTEKTQQQGASYLPLMQLFRGTVLVNPNRTLPLSTFLKLDRSHIIDRGM